MGFIQASKLQPFATELLEAGGASAEEAATVAEGLVGANLRGYDSHGVMRIPFYLDMIQSGAIVPGAELTVTNESDSRLVTDANWGFGQVQAAKLLEALMAKSHANGLAVGTIMHCGHIGRLGEYCERAAKAGLVSMLMVNSHGAVVRVSPPGGKAPRLSTNPIAIGVPHEDAPLILDFSTSATAEGKVRVKQIAGEQCPDGWLLDNEGTPTKDPNTLYGNPPGSILPMGGDQAYKGFGLSLMIDILCGALSGGLTARENPYPKKGNCVFMLLLDPAHFGGAEHFQTEVSQLIEYQRSCPTVAGVEQITLPGDPERHAMEQRQREGICFDDENWSKLKTLAAKLNVSVPQ